MAAGVGDVEVVGGPAGAAEARRGWLLRGPLAIDAGPVVRGSRRWIAPLPKPAMYEDPAAVEREVVGEHASTERPATDMRRGSATWTTVISPSGLRVRAT